MFRNLKLKNTTLCKLSFFIIPIIIVIIGFIAAIFIPVEEFASAAIILSIGFAMFLIVSRLGKIFSALTLISMLKEWQNDRTSFETDLNGITCTEVEASIVKRVSKWGKEISVQSDAAFARYKKTNSFGTTHKKTHQTILLYRLPTLTFDEYQKRVEAAANYAKTLIKNKNTESSAVAIIFLTNQTEPEVIKCIRSDFPDEYEYVAIPLLYEEVSRKYYFSAIKDTGLLGKTCKSTIIDTLVRLVFGGKLPLENNEYFDYENEISSWQEKTLGDLIDDIKQEDENDRQFIKNTYEQLSDGQVLYKDETLYVKYNDKLASFIIFFEEDKPEKVSAWCGDIWDYPKETDISKKDKKALEELVADYFKGENKQVEFELDDES